MSSRYPEWGSAAQIQMEARGQFTWIEKMLSEYLEGDLDKLGLRGLHYTSRDDRQGGVPHTCTKD